MIRLDVLHGGHLRQRHEAVRAGGDGDDVAEGETLLGLHLGTERAQIGLGLFLRAGEEHHVQPAPLGQCVPPDGEREERHVQFVVRLEGQDALHALGDAELLGEVRAAAHEVGVVRHVADDLRARAAQHVAEALVNRPARLHQPTARLLARTKVCRHFHLQRLLRLDQRVAQQHGGLAAEERGVRLLRVAETEREARVAAEGEEFRQSGCSGRDGIARSGAAREDAGQTGEALPNRGLRGGVGRDVAGLIAQAHAVAVLPAERGGPEEEQADQEPISAFHTRDRDGAATLRRSRAVEQYGLLLNGSDERCSRRREADSLNSVFMLRLLTVAATPKSAGCVSFAVTNSKVSRSIVRRDQLKAFDDEAREDQRRHGHADVNRRQTRRRQQARLRQPVNPHHGAGGLLTGHLIVRRHALIRTAAHIHAALGGF